jgi:hypothetical protein
MLAGRSAPTLPMKMKGFGTPPRDSSTNRLPQLCVDAEGVHVCKWPDSEVLARPADFRLLRYCGLVLLTRLSHFDCHPSETSAVISTVME